MTAVDSAGRIFEYDGGSWTAADPGESAIRGVDSVDGAVVACGEGGVVYRRTDDGWTSAGVSLYDVAVVAGDDVTVAGGSGRLFRYDGAVWTERKLGGNTRYSIARDDDRGLVGGGSGRCSNRDRGGTGTYTGPSKNLQGTLVTTDPTVPKIVCGGDGTIREQSFVDPLS